MTSDSTYLEDADPRDYLDSTILGKIEKHVKFLSEYKIKDFTNSSIKSVVQAVSALVIFEDSCMTFSEVESKAFQNKLSPFKWLPIRKVSLELQNLNLDVRSAVKFYQALNDYLNEVSRKVLDNKSLMDRSQDYAVEAIKALDTATSLDHCSKLKQARDYAVESYNEIAESWALVKFPELQLAIRDHTNLLMYTIILSKLLLDLSKTTGGNDYDAITKIDTKSKLQDYAVPVKKTTLKQYTRKAKTMSLDDSDQES